MRNKFLCAFLLMLQPCLAQAQSAASAMQAFGLFGTWAGECRQGASPANNHVTYVGTPAGGVQLRYDAGADYDDITYDITEAKQIAPDRISMRQVLASNKEVTLDIVILKEQDRIRIWTSAFPDGTLLVEDGILSSFNGRETRWMAHCP
jgi:hypothetical protein